MVLAPLQIPQLSLMCLISCHGRWKGCWWESGYRMFWVWGGPGVVRVSPVHPLLYYNY